MKNKAVLYGITILIGLIVIEAGAFITGKIGASIGVLYEKKVVNGDYEEGYKEYLSIRDDRLGWVMKDNAERDMFQDAAGSRITPAFADPEAYPNCVSLYGDSYTYSSEVDGEHAWGNLLSQELDCRVANFGVGGYGSDQAYLWYLQNTADDSPVVVLNHLAENILRNVGQFRGLMSGPKGNPFSFKPRFIVDEDDKLTLVEMPTFAPEEFERVMERPEDYLPYEYFAPGGDSGLRRLEFPYVWSVMNIFGHFHVQSWFSGKPWYMDFYEPNHPSGGLQVTSAIMQAFHADALENGRIPVLTIIPTGQSLRYFRKTGVWPYQPLIDSLQESGLSVLNFGAGMMQRIGDEDPCSLFDNCDAHFNELGYAMLADIAYEEFARRGLLELIATQAQ